MELIPTLFWATLGAFCGDILSYWIGAHYNERLVGIWPFSRYPRLLTKGKNFFHKHGGKSVILGRFFGPARNLVPLIAGLMNMRLSRFLFACIPSAMLWSFVYMVPGILIGALSLELPPALATQFVLTVLAIIVLMWLLFIIIQGSFKKIAITVDRWMAACWSYFLKHKNTLWIPALLDESHGPRAHKQLTLAIFALICLALFAWVFICVIAEVGLVHLNVPLFELFRSLRIPMVDNFMIAVTLLGDKYVLLPAACLIFVGLLWRRYIWAGLHGFGIVIISAGLVELMKRIYFFPRPSGLLNQALSSSFPSGHVVLALSVYGFLAMLLAQNLSHSKRKIIYVITTALILAVAISRLYLDAHWFTDVLGGVFLGLTCILLVTLSYRRIPHLPVTDKRFIWTSPAVILMVWLAYGVTHFRSLQDDYTLYWPTATLDMQAWWEHKTEEIPLFLASRLGKPQEVLNVEWVGSLEHIRKLLVSQGWQDHSDALSIKNSLHRLSDITNPQHIPLLPTLYQNKAPVLFMTQTDKEGRQLNLELWRSNVMLQDSPETLWIGSLHYYSPIKELKKPRSYQDAMQTFTAFLKNFQLQIIRVPQYQQPHVMQFLNWDRRLLLIRSTQEASYESP